MTETTTTWVEGAAGSLFDLDNLPYGVFSLRDQEGGGDDPRVGVRIGDHVLDLAPVAEIGDPASVLAAAWRTPSLNAFMAMGPEQWAIAREWIVEVLGHDVHEARTAPHLHPLTAVELHLPIEVGDYVDFYASEHHASNVGRIFRPDQEPLLPNWKHLPVGYHGRSGTVVASGTDIVRPCGQRKAPADDAPTYGPAVASTSRPSSASWSARRRVSASGCPPPTSLPTPSAWSVSTTGPHATCRRGSTSPSDRSSASRSRPPSATG